MSKLKLPPAVLNGTPLTESEMKEIIGGIKILEYCSCTLYITNGTRVDRKYSMTSGIPCADICMSECSKLNKDDQPTSCYDYCYETVVDILP